PGESAELAARATVWYLEDTDDLGLGMPDHLPKATESVPQIVHFIEELIETGHAYPVGGDVYFRVASFPAYGRLSGQKPDQVAQSQALGHPFAQIWTHNGMLRFTGEKMSKSVGNVETIREAIDQWGRETVLVFFLTASWRKPIDYSDETMTQAAARLERLRNAFTLDAAEHDEGGWQAFAAALDDDFDTPAALAVLHDCAS